MANVYRYRTPMLAGLAAAAALMVSVLGATPASAGVICSSPDLPPGCGEYRTPADVHAAFADPDPLVIEAILHDVSHSRFLNVVRTPIGPDELEDFDSTLEALVDVNLTAGGWLYDIPVSLSGPVSVLTHNKVGNTTGTFQTEMIAMSLSGDMFGMPVIVRESPSLSTLGQTTITDLGGGLYEIDSFFDVFTELSLNGGAFVAQSAGPSRVDLVEPPTCGDGLIEGAEECDDGGTTPGDGCDASCQIEPDWTCVGEPSVCTEYSIPALPKWGYVALAGGLIVVGAAVMWKRAT
jgi:cysteine-rich repeat protein